MTDPVTNGYFTEHLIIVVDGRLPVAQGMQCDLLVTVEYSDYHENSTATIE